MVRKISEEEIEYVTRLKLRAREHGIKIPPHIGSKEGIYNYLTARKELYKLQIAKLEKTIQLLKEKVDFINVLLEELIQDRGEQE